MTEQEQVNERLGAQMKRLSERAKAPSGAEDDADKALIFQSLALISEALIKVARDGRYVRRQFTEVQ